MTIAVLEILLSSVFLTIVLVPSFGALAVRMNAVDLPNERKVHTRPIPRTGGVAMAVAAFISLLAFAELDHFLVAYLVGSAVLVGAGLLDDLYDLSPKVKFAAQILAAVIIVWFGNVSIMHFGSLLPEGWLLPFWITGPFTAFVIVGVTNAVNLSDGLDGLAGGVSLLILLGIGYLAFRADSQNVVFASLALGGVLFGFLRFNTHPATIFMGDAGSQFLGYSVIVLSLYVTQNNQAYSPILPLLLAGVPILDTLTVMSIRIVRGQSPFTADKNHLHHNLMKLGLLHPESVLVIYLLQVFLISAAVLFRFYNDWLLLCGYLLFSGMLLRFLQMAERTSFRPVSIQRYNHVVAATVRSWKRRGRLIRIFFPVFEYGLPFMLVLSALLTEVVPAGIKSASGMAALLIVMAQRWAPRHLPQLLHLAVYLLIPCLVFYSGRQDYQSIPAGLMTGYNLLFGLFPILMLLISKLSRRSGGFKSTPLDFLVIVLACAMPFLPVSAGHQLSIGMMAAKIILLYFCFEVLFAELRKKWWPVAVLTSVALLIVALKDI
jgi:UDP-GlcNAc:undecaprenyl-phosphate GlcNAc-1-phosphate transferase